VNYLNNCMANINEIKIKGFIFYLTKTHRIEYMLSYNYYIHSLILLLFLRLV